MKLVPSATSAIPKTPVRVKMVTVHRRRPRGYVVRVWVQKGWMAVPQIYRCTSLKGCRAFVPDHMRKRDLSPGDSTELLEFWS